MMRTVVFAHYDNNGIVHDYVITYLRYLKEIADNIIFIADNEAQQAEKDKIKDLVCHYEFSHHGEYDFGSYKRGFQYALKSGLLDQTDELVLCNDSCFCVDTLTPVFKKMESVNCDFYAITDSKMITYHLQSYFLVFKKAVFKSNVFKNFLDKVVEHASAKDVINNYELKLTFVLEENGFVANSFIRVSNNVNPTVYPIRLLETKDPLIKRKVFTTLKACEESPRKLLMILMKNYRQSYNDICKYFKIKCFYLFPLFLPRDYAALRRFLFQKKIPNNGRLVIKICHVPITNKISRFIVDLIKRKGV